eukprot:tig00000076_g2316.t1
MQAAEAGTLRGLGRPAVGMVVNFVAFGVFGLLAAYLFAFRLAGGLPGLWWGLASGTAAAAVLLLAFLARADWPAEARRARLRSSAGTGGGAGADGYALLGRGEGWGPVDEDEEEEGEEEAGVEEAGDVEAAPGGARGFVHRPGRFEAVPPKRPRGPSLDLGPSDS